MCGAKHIERVVQLCQTCACLFLMQHWCFGSTPKQMPRYSVHFSSTRKALRHRSHDFTCNYTNSCLYLVCVCQMAPPQTKVADI